MIYIGDVIKQTFATQYTDKLSQIKAEIAQLRREIGEQQSAYSALASVAGLTDWIFGSNDSGWVSDQFRPKYEKLVSRLEELKRDERYYAPLAEKEAYQLAQAKALQVRMEEEARKQEERKREESAIRKREAEKRKAQQLADKARKKEEAMKTAEKERAAAAKRSEDDKRKAQQFVVARERGDVEKKREEAERKAREARFARLKRDAVVEGCVISLRDFGAIIDIGGVNGLLHISNMSWKRVAHPSEVVNVGQKIKVKILNVDREQQRVSLGLKQITPNPWDSITKGTCLSGKVTQLVDYGAFIEISPGIKGLVHISELSWAKCVAHPSEMLNVGQKIKVKILEVDRKHGRISFSIKRMTPNPWDTVQDRFPVGLKVKGRVHNFTAYGAFVEIDEGIDGMIHVSDMSWTRKVNHPSECLQKGQEVETIVLAVNAKEQRISLGLKQMQEDPWVKISKRFPVGRIVKGKVSKIYRSGALLETEDGVEGNVHISQISDKYIKNVEDVLNVGQDVKAQVISVDVERHHMDLSIRELSKNNSNDSNIVQVKECFLNHYVIIDYSAILHEYEMLGSRILVYLLDALEDNGCPVEKIKVAYCENDLKWMKDNHDKIGLTLIEEHNECFLNAQNEERDCPWCKDAIRILPSHESSPPDGVCSMIVHNNIVSVPELGVETRMRMKRMYPRITHAAESTSKPVDDIHGRTSNPKGRVYDIPRLNINEGESVEFKSTIIYSSKTNSPYVQRLEESQPFAIAREIAAFMNAEGGDLYLGVNNEGYVVGINRDFEVLNEAVINGFHGTDMEYAQYKPTKDGYRQKIDNIVSLMLGKYAASFISVEFQQEDEVEYVKLHVEACRDKFIFLGPHQSVYARLGQATRILEGQDLEDYRRKRFG